MLPDLLWTAVSTSDRPKTRSRKNLSTSLSQNYPNSFLWNAKGWETGARDVLSVAANSLQWAISFDAQRPSVFKKKDTIHRPR